jgi:hypothetical protein
LAKPLAYQILVNESQLSSTEVDYTSLLTYQSVTDMIIIILYSPIHWFETSTSYASVISYIIKQVYTYLVRCSGYFDFITIFVGMSMSFYATNLDSVSLFADSLFFVTGK